MDDYFKEQADKLINWAGEKAVQLLLAVIIFFVGIKLAKFVVNLLKKIFDRRNVEKTVAHFTLSLVRWTIYVITFIVSISVVGIQVTSSVTLLGSAGITLGFALQGSLSNLAGGILILLVKPFKVGDYILENHSKTEGVVDSIDIFYTKLRTIENKVVVIPNGTLTNNSVINFTALDQRIILINIGVDYGSDLNKVRETLLKVLKADSRVIDPEQSKIYVDSYGSSAIVFGLRAYVASSEYWPCRWAILENIKTAFDEEGITIPFAQVVVHEADKMRLN